MNAKHSVILLSGLLLLMMGIAWAQSSDTAATPTCPALADNSLQEMLKPTAWARADWNARTSRWEIDCKQLDAIANMPPRSSNAVSNSLTNTAVNATRSTPTRRKPRNE